MSAVPALARSATPEVERRYDSEEDRLFLIYYALPPGLNGNKWGVTDRSLPINIKTAINKPVIILRKNPANPFHSQQAGLFVHPTVEEFVDVMKRPVTEEEYYNWQSKYAVGIVRDVEARRKGYAWSLEITDPEAKNLLKSDAYRDGIPGYTSPLILTYPDAFPNESRTGVYDHWIVGHVILTDAPAYGFQKSSLAAKCIGPLQDCRIQTKYASQQDIGFCVKQALIDLLSSSQKASSEITDDIMSTNEGSPQPTRITETPNPQDPQSTVTKTFSEQNPKQEPDKNVSPPQGSDYGEGDIDHEQERSKEQQEEQPTNANLPQNIEDAHKVILQLTENNKSLMKEMKTFKKDLDSIKMERKQYQLQTIIPRSLFKSDESYLKEVQKAMNENVPESYLREYWNNKRELADLKASHTETPVPIASKTAALEVADYTKSGEKPTGEDHSSTIVKTLNLQRMITGGSA